MTPSLIMLLVQFGLQYGPEAVTNIITLLNNKTATLADVESAFAGLKPYSAYGINPPAIVSVATPAPVIA